MEKKVWKVWILIIENFSLGMIELDIEAVLFVWISRHTIEFTEMKSNIFILKLIPTNDSGVGSLEKKNFQKI
jgi:hypothetical protein